MKHWALPIGILLVLVAIGFSLFRFFDKQPDRESEYVVSIDNTLENKKASHKNPFSENFSRGRCEGSGTVEFSHLPMDIGDIGAVQPYGTMVGAHVVPTDHGYFAPIIFNSARDAYPVYAVAEGYIVNVSHRGQAVGDNQDPNHVTDEYQMQFEHSCTFYSYYDLLTSLSPELSAEVGKLTGFESKSVRIKVKAGQLVGRIGGQTVDFAVWNFDQEPDFVANVDSYKGQESRLYLDDMFAHFAEPIKTQLMAKVARVTEPRSGKINYDIAGKLVGNWFKEGSGGFNGPPNIQNEAGGRYWDGHLAISYDYIDPTALKFSIGNWEGAATQFAIKGNAPDPATIGVDSGLIKYELVQGGYINGDTGEGWMLDSAIPNPKYQGNSQVQGTVLLQLTDPTTLKVELFPGKTAAQISDFSSAAQTYTR